MEREPKQARSVASMHRMLDAAESLLALAGPDALTIEQVVRTSGTSTGSFYARFGDRQGLLIAMQDRFLDRLGETLSDTFESHPTDTDLSRTVHRLVREFLGAFRTHRSAFIAFMLLNRSEPSMRARGAVASREAARTIAQLIEYHADQINHPDPHLAADFAYRTLFALATQTVMFDDPEVSPLGYRTQTREQQTAHLLLAYLQTHQTETAEKVGSDPPRAQRQR